MHGSYQGTQSINYLWITLRRAAPDLSLKPNGAKWVDLLEKNGCLQIKYFPELPEHDKKRYCVKNFDAILAIGILREFLK